MLACTILTISSCARRCLTNASERAMPSVSPPPGQFSISPELTTSPPGTSPIKMHRSCLRAAKIAAVIAAGPYPTMAMSNKFSLGIDPELGSEALAVVANDNRFALALPNHRHRHAHLARLLNHSPRLVLVRTHINFLVLNTVFLEEFFCCPAKAAG